MFLNYDNIKENMTSFFMQYTKFKVSMMPFWIEMYAPQGQNQALVMVVLKFTYRNYPVYQFLWFYHQLQQLDP